MDVGMLILLNFLTIPFICELEILGSRLKAVPTFFELIRLRAVRSSRWVWGYLVILTLFAILTIAPSASGRSYEASGWFILFVVILQFALWGGVFFKILRK